MLERFFKLSENQTTARTELLAGFTTFLTMAYIIVVQPAVLSGDVRNENRLGLRRGHYSDVSVCRARDCTDGVARALSHRTSAGHGRKFFLCVLHDPGGDSGGFCQRLAGRAGRRVHFRRPVPDPVARRPARDDLQRRLA